MLFTTLAFACGFLPVVFVVFYVLGRHSHAAAAGWLFLASVFFYGYWMPEFTLLLLGSIAANFFFGHRIAHNVAGGDGSPGRARAKRWLILGIVFDLGLLSYFKYANFFVGSLDSLLGLGWNIDHITLPIGISFFSFTQIAFLADTYQKGIAEYRPTHYGLFVTYFPHLVAGPVLHHAQMMPQFGEASTYRINGANVAAGASIFAIGLFKKIVLADSISPYADAVFGAADGGTAVHAGEAWIGALAYTFQLYFDFSGYSDMAVGLSLMFNIRLPYNFDSPYRSFNISDFWRRWHMTLSAFLRDYLYIPLGGNRHGGTRRYVNLMTTMLLGGLWHGASWTFVFWGGLHGLYLGINHGFRAAAGARLETWSRNWGYKVACWALTFLGVVIAWVFFRAESFSGAGRVLAGMGGMGPVASVESKLFWNAGLGVAGGVAHCVVLGLIAVGLPNSNRMGERILARCREGGALRWLVLGFASMLALLLVVVNDTRVAASPFIYFNF